MMIMNQNFMSMGKFRHSKRIVLGGITPQSPYVRFQGYNSRSLSFSDHLSSLSVRTLTHGRTPNALIPIRSNNARQYHHHFRHSTMTRRNGMKNLTMSPQLQLRYIYQHKKCHLLPRRVPLSLTTNKSRIRKRYASTKDNTTAATTNTVAAEEPSLKTLQLLAISTGIPFVGFGFMDNAILVIAGDAIDITLGVYLGISTLCAAAIGNIISDLCGIGLGTLIEDFCANTLKLPVPQLTTAQRQLRSVRLANQFGMAVGMTFGCIIGMFPLLFIDSHKADKLRTKAQLEHLYQDVMDEAKTLINAESTCLYLRVNINDTEEEEKMKNKSGIFNWKAASTSSVTVLPYKPSANGEYLYAMYSVFPQKAYTSHQYLKESVRKQLSNDGNDPATSTKTNKIASTTIAQERLVPVGKGIVSRPILTGDTWNIHYVNDEPDFFPSIPPSKIGDKKNEEQQLTRRDYRNIVVVPILDGRGRAIGVLEALNKKSEGGGTDDEDDDGFTDQDVEILKSLASHISVSLQDVYQDAEEDDVRLRDTIRIFREMGIQGITDNKVEGFSGQGGVTIGKKPSLFPTTSSSPTSSSRTPSKGIQRSKTSKLFPAD